ncbi:MAG: hypothetical protein HQ538_00100, partial [Parcubacteria group bacterium]|nr:hypothetical protein [Parcubacteria group bacterium]
KKYKELGITLSNVYPIHKEFRFSPSLKSVEIYSTNKPLFYNFFRGYDDKRSFDVELSEVAKNNGVRIYFNQSIKNMDANDIDIVATGTPYTKKMILGYGGHYKNISNTISNSLYIFLNNDHSPHAYAYVLPFSNNEASVVIVSSQMEDKNSLKKRFNLFKKSNTIVRNMLKNAELENEISGVASFCLPNTAIKDNKLYVGEAAGFLDAGSGFGVHYAIWSGYLATRAIIEGRNYDELWKEMFGIELKKQFSKRLHLEKLNNSDYEDIINNLVKNYGKRISAKKYSELHKHL